MINTIPTVPTEIAAILGIDTDQVRVYADRWGLKPEPYSKDEPLNKDTAVSWLENFVSRTRNEEAKEKARELLVENGVGIPLREKQVKNVSDLVGDTKSPKAKRKYKAKVVTEPKEEPNKTPVFLKVVLVPVVLVAMVVQMNHTAAVCGVGSQASVYINWAFAFAIQFTALLLTVYKGGKHYLIAFALAEFFINMLYYKPWADHGVEVWFRSVLLSALLSFTIFSYSEVLSALSNIKSDGPI